MEFCMKYVNREKDSQKGRKEERAALIIEVFKIRDSYLP